MSEEPIKQGYFMIRSKAKISYSSTNFFENDHENQLIWPEIDPNWRDKVSQTGSSEAEQGSFFLQHCSIDSLQGAVVAFLFERRVTNAAIRTKNSNAMGMKLLFFISVGLFL